MFFISSLVRQFTIISVYEDPKSRKILRFKKSLHNYSHATEVEYKLNLEITTKYNRRGKDQQTFKAFVNFI